MITVRTGSYTQIEKESLGELFQFLADSVCKYCKPKTGCSVLNCQRCDYRHIIYDMCHVDSPKKNDNSVT